MGDRCGGTAAATAGLMIPLRLTSQPDDKRARRLAAGGFISGSSRISPARWWLGGLVQGCAFGNVASLQSGATRGAAHVLTLTFKGTLGANESPSRPRLCQNDGHHSREAGEKLVVVVEPKEDDGAKGVANQRPERRQQPYHLPSGLCRFTLSLSLSDELRPQRRQPRAGRGPARGSIFHLLRPLPSGHQPGAIGAT